MFEHLIALEAVVDSELPRPRLRGRPSRELMARAHEWSEAVWRAAEGLGPFPLTAAETARGLEVARRPVFVCGVHRSGTTLVRDLLDGHPALAVLPSEGSYYMHHRRHLSVSHPRARRHFLACEWCRRLANPINQAPYWLIGRSTATSSPSVAFMRSVASWWTTLADALSPSASAWPLAAIALGYASFAQCGVLSDEVRRWAEKTPLNERALDQIWQDFPDAKVVHVVRDPIAVMVSRKRMEERATGAFANLRAAVSDLAQSYRIANVERSRNQPRRYLLLRFEEVVAAPDDTMRRVAEFLEVSDLPILRRPTTAGLDASSNSSFETADGVIDRTRARVDGRSLSDDERLRLAVALGDAAAALGYVVPA